MTQPFSQNIIAMVWDFDRTLIPGHMQAPLFETYDVDEQVFWHEVDDLHERCRKQGLSQTSNEVLYLNHILDYVRRGIFKGLNNGKLRDFGRELAFYPGLPEFFGEIKQMVVSDEEYQRCDIKVEHYVVSAGLAQMIRGSALGEYLDGVWGCEFIDEEGGDGTRLSQIGYVIDHTTKTRAIFEISKGVNVDPERIDVNARMEESERRVPIGQMIYVADGPSDVPVFSLVKRYSGRTYAVYNPEFQKAYDQAYDLMHSECRVDSIGAADYRPETPTWRWLMRTVKDIADKILKRHIDRLEESVGTAPGHLRD